MQELLIEKFKNYLALRNPEKTSINFQKLIIVKDLLFAIFEGVYQPSDESIFLLENIELYQGESVLDIGTGSGLLALSLSPIAKKVVGIDIDSNSIECSIFNAKINNIKNCDFIEGDLFNSVGEEKFDLIIANLPHIPTSSDDTSIDFVGRCVNGGEDGRRVLDQFLKHVSFYIKPTGRIQIVQSELANISKTIDLLSNQGFNVVISASKDEPFGRTVRERVDWYKKMGIEIKYDGLKAIETNYIITGYKSLPENKKNQ